MAKQTNSRLVRLTVYISKRQGEAATREAKELGYKNANRWAAAKLLPLIQDVMGRKRIDGGAFR